MSDNVWCDLIIENEQKWRRTWHAKDQGQDADTIRSGRSLSTTSTKAPLQFAFTKTGGGIQDLQRFHKVPGREGRTGRGAPGSNNSSISPKAQLGKSFSKLLADADARTPGSPASTAGFLREAVASSPGSPGGVHAAGSTAGASQVLRRSATLPPSQGLGMSGTAILRMNEQWWTWDTLRNRSLG
eukprot:TRINITY_DN5315_c0_g2_i1.p1 TRINITY_DN5315_c0_g2~~TRINITY_DN5315_c0_g2_i1.p1  ORF type:complete len:185 (+),score=24.84 TRINITY_DN5315_c0_g2_i1:31-585(+)